RPRFRSVGLAKTLEYIWQKIRCNSLSVILDADDGFFIVNFATNQHFAAGRRKLDRVAYQIPEDLQEPRAIPSHNFAGAIVNLQVEFNIMRGGNWTNRLDGLAQHRREWDG